MSNVLFDELPKEWNGYPINWWFQIGVQIYLVSEDKSLLDFERSEIILDLLFADKDNCPDPEGIQECIKWFLNGWCHDRSPKEKDKKKLLDFHKDQWRIYADFRQIYGINLNEESELHWWEFMGMLWNMPTKQSSFLQVIEIRNKKIKKKMSSEEKKAIKTAQYIYGLEDRPVNNKDYTEEEKKKIDNVDMIREKMKKRRLETEEALNRFRR